MDDYRGCVKLEGVRKVNPGLVLNMGTESKIGIFFMLGEVLSCSKWVLKESVGTSAKGISAVYHMGRLRT